MSENERKIFISCEEDYGMEYKREDRSRRRILMISIIMILVIVCTNTLLIFFTVWSLRNPQEIQHKAITDLNLLSDWDKINTEFLLNKSRQLPDHIDYYTQCDILWDDISRLKYLHNGWSKVVYSGVYHNSSVAVKTIYFEGRDVQKCLESYTVLECYHRAASKMFREIILLSHLNVEYVLKVRAVCIPESLSENGEITRNNLITLVTELGTPINLITLLQTSLNQQLKMVSEVSHLLSQITRTSLGSLTLNDLRREQFVLINNSLTLSDIDDVTRENILCKNDQQCATESNRSVPCIDGRCPYTNCHNLHSASVHLLTPLLTGVPAVLNTEEIIAKYSECLASEEQLVIDVNELIDKFSNYSTLPDNYTIPGYNRIQNSDMAGYGDYSCKYSNQPVCSMTASSLSDAIYLCDSEPQCLTVVISKHRTWNARLEVVLKNSKPNKGNLTPNHAMTVYHLTHKYLNRPAENGS